VIQVDIFFAQSLRFWKKIPLPLPGIQGLEHFHNSSGSGHSTDDIGSGDDAPETDSDQMDEEAGSVTLQDEAAASLLEEGALEHDEHTSGAISSLLQDIAGIEVNEIDTAAGFEAADVVDRTTELPVDSLGRDFLGEPGMGNRVHAFYPSCLGFSLLIYKLYLMSLYLPVPLISLIKQSFFFFHFLLACLAIGNFNYSLLFAAEPMMSVMLFGGGSDKVRPILLVHFGEGLGRTNMNKF
jgi:hypothetical protein